eukprot:2365759-Prymnesium_polylepis.1
MKGWGYRRRGRLIDSPAHLRLVLDRKHARASCSVVSLVTMMRSGASASPGGGRARLAFRTFTVTISAQTCAGVP